MTPEELQDLRAKHQTARTSGKLCHECLMKWPCDVIKILDSVQQALSQFVNEHALKLTDAGEVDSWQRH